MAVGVNLFGRGAFLIGSVSSPDRTGRSRGLIHPGSKGTCVDRDAVDPDGLVIAVNIAGCGTDDKVVRENDMS